MSRCDDAQGERQSKISLARRIAAEARFYTSAMQRGALRVFYLWTMVFAVLMAALAPTLTQAMQASGDSNRLFVCSQLGPKWIAADVVAPDGQKKVPDGEHAYAHCPYCTVHAAGLGMPPAPFQAAALPLSHSVHWRYSAATPTLDFWSDALSRGPPLLA